MYVGKWFLIKRSRLRQLQNFSSWKIPTAHNANLLTLHLTRDETSSNKDKLSADCGKSFEGDRDKHWSGREPSLRKDGRDDPHASRPRGGCGLNAQSPANRIKTALADCCLCRHSDSRWPNTLRRAFSSLICDIEKRRSAFCVIYHKGSF